VKLRDYQTNSVTALYEWFENNETGNPCLCLPGGSGKSVIIAAIVKDALQNWPGTRVLMLVHSKTLIAQNAEKLRVIWPNAPMGIYSAGLNRRCLTEPITYAGIGSVAKRAQQLGHIDICLIDEAHAISNEEEGQYRQFMAELMEINPSVRFVGLSASPYRLGQGLITDGEKAIFKDIIEPVNIEDLLNDAYLAPLRSKHTSLTLSTEGVAHRGNEFVAGALERAIDTHDNNVRAVNETIQRAEDCKSWMVFCTGISHCDHITELLVERGIKAASVHGRILDSECDKRIEAHKRGELTCIVSVGKLTTGYDNPLIDLIVFLNPTESPGKFLQCAVRGMRPVYAKGYDLDVLEDRFLAMENGAKPNGCKVLDFAGNVAKHGPVTAIVPPTKARKGEGTAPTKVCPHCEEICAVQSRTCESCGHEFPPPEVKEKSVYLRNDDILGIEPTEMQVTSWAWKKHTSRTSGLDMLQVRYYGGLSNPAIVEYHAVNHTNYAGIKARQTVADMAKRAGVTVSEDLDQCAFDLTNGKPPSMISHKKNGKFFNVIDRVWSKTE